MKTIAARFSDELFELLSLVAKLEESSIVDQIREAVEALLARKMADGNLAARAEEALAEIDREAAAKKAALAGLVEAVSDKATTPKTSSRRRGRNGGEAAPQAQGNPIGYAAARARREQ